MKLTQERSGNKLTVGIEGALNTLTAPELTSILGDNLADVDELLFDLSKLEYVSSAGLRVFLATQQYMDDKDGDMKVTGVNDVVVGIFTETGFNRLLDII